MRLGSPKKDAGHKVCCMCIEGLRLYKNGKTINAYCNSNGFWELQNHFNDCCMLHVKGYISKCEKHIVYPNTLSANRPAAHSESLQIPILPTTLEDLTEVIESSSGNEGDVGVYKRKKTAKII